MTGGRSRGLPYIYMHKSRIGNRHADFQKVTPGTVPKMSARVHVSLPAVSPSGLGRSPSSTVTYILGSWVVSNKGILQGPGTGTYHIGNWASRVRWVAFAGLQQGLVPSDQA